MGGTAPGGHPVLARVPAFVGVLGAFLLVAQGCSWSSALLDAPLHAGAASSDGVPAPVRTVEVVYRVTGGTGTAHVAARTSPGETAGVRTLPYTWSGPVDLGDHVHVSAAGGTGARPLTCTISMGGVVVKKITGADVVCDGYAGREDPAAPG